MSDQNSFLILGDHLFLNCKKQGRRRLINNGMLINSDLTLLYLVVNHFVHQRNMKWRATQNMSVLWLDSISFVWFCILVYLSGWVTSTKSVEPLKCQLDKVRTWHLNYFDLFWRSTTGACSGFRCCCSGGRERCKAGCGISIYRR